MWELWKNKVKLQKLLLEQSLEKYDNAVTTIHPLEPYVRTQRNKVKRKKEEIKAALANKKKVVRPAHLEKAVEDLKDFKPAPHIFVSGDGDGIGATVEQKVMANDLEGIIRQSEVIKQGQAYMKHSFEAIDGKMLVHGGDDNLALVSGDHLSKLEKIREGYKKITGYTITFGVGNNMRDAVKALVYGKLTGKDRLVYWDDSLNEKLKEIVKPQTPQEKYSEHGLLPDDITEKSKKKVTKSSTDISEPDYEKQPDTPQSQIGQQPLTVRGVSVKDNRSSFKNKWTGAQFDAKEGVLHTQLGSFKTQIPGHEKPSQGNLFPADKFKQAMENPEVQKLHEQAMGNWFKIHNLNKQGKLPESVKAHAALFTVLSANNAVPMQELSYARLVDTMRKHNVDPTSHKFGEMMDYGGQLREGWHMTDSPQKLPTHSKEYFERIADSIRQKYHSDTTGRVPGDIVKMQYIDSASDKLRHYPKYHDYLNNLTNLHGTDTRSIVGQMMADKLEYHKKSKKDLGHPMSLGGGFANKVARYYSGMMGGGNSVVPDTHFVRHLFGLDSKTDKPTHDYIKKVLWHPRNHDALNDLDEHYEKNFPTVPYVQKKYFNGEKTPQAVFPAFWLHWLAISAHEKMNNLGKPWAARNHSDHTPFFDVVNAELDKHGLSDIKKDDGDTKNEVPLPMRTASLMHELEGQLGHGAASMVYYSKIVPHLLKLSSGNNMNSMLKVKKKNSKLKDMIKYAVKNRLDVFGDKQSGMSTKGGPAPKGDVKAAIKEAVRGKKSIKDKLKILKGAMRRLAPFNPHKDISSGERSSVGKWQMMAKPTDREGVPQMSDATRKRSLHKLSSKTLVRRSGDGGREFLLHRGMSAKEHKTNITGKNYTSHSSWTPDYGTASDHAREADGLFDDNSGKVSSAWVNEKDIHHIPKQIGRVEGLSGVPVKGQNTFQEEHEIIVKPHQLNLATPEEVKAHRQSVVGKPPLKHRVAALRDRGRK